MIEETQQDQGNATTETDAGTESDNNVPTSRLNEVIGQRNDLRTEIATLQSTISKTQANDKAKREESLMANEKHEVVISELKTELAVKTEEAAEWIEFKTARRKTLTEKLPENRQYIANQIGDMESLEKFVEEETQALNQGRMTESRPGQQPGGEFGGYGSDAEWAQKDAKGYQAANNTVAGSGIIIGYGPGVNE